MRLNKYNLTNKEIKILDSIEYDENDINYLKVQIRKYLTEKYPIEILKKNWDEIVKLGRDSSSLKSYITRYGIEIGNKLFKEKTKASTMTKEDYIRKYGKELANEKLSNRGASVENYINRHGEEIGTLKWNEYCQKRKNTYTKRRKAGQYAHMSHNLEWFQKRYGNDEGYEVWDAKRKLQAYKVSKAYYVETYGKEEGELRCAASKSRSLENFINKYGEEEGKKRYNTWLYNVVSGLKNRRNYSIWATECCDFIKRTVEDLYYYGENEMIWQLPGKYQEQLGQKIISPDLFYRGKIVEFHGDVFHGNPDLFEGKSTPHPFKKNTTSAELWRIDKCRKEYYNSRGYDVLEIWENNYKLDKAGVIDKCLTFLK